MTQVAREIAEMLFSIGAVEVRPKDPFIYASGLKGPIYCDNRKVLSHPIARNLVKSSFVSILKEEDWKFDQLAGLATAGIAHAALMADALEAPMLYIRSKAKGHGKGNQIEGDYKDGQKLVLVEDLINQGSSLESALFAVESAQLKYTGCLSIVTYQMQKAQDICEKWSLPVRALTTFDTLCETALHSGLINSEGRELLSLWRNDPKGWSV